MKGICLNFILAAYVAASSDCWAPSVSQSTGCSLCPSDKLKGDHCLHSGTSSSCYATAELCCQDSSLQQHISTANCIAEAKKALASVSDVTAEDSDSDSDSDSDDDDISDIDEEECLRVVSRTSQTTNRHCMIECSNLMKKGISPSSDKKWSDLCMPSHWHEQNGRTVPDGGCFEKWVYGYAEPDNLAGYKTSVTAKTPAVCQAHCQESDECIHWLWVSPLHAPGLPPSNTCLLKSKAMVDGSLSVITEMQPPLNQNVNFCNSQMGYTCQNLYKCLSCQGQRRCVWESDLHISGWKFCGHTDSCQSDLTPSEKLFAQPTQHGSTSATKSQGMEVARSANGLTTLGTLRSRTKSLQLKPVESAMKH